MTTHMRHWCRARVAAVRTRGRAGWEWVRLVTGWPSRPQPREWIAAARARTATIAVVAVIAVAVGVWAGGRDAGATGHDVAAEAAAKRAAPVCTTEHHPIRICTAAPDSGLLPELDRYAIRLSQLDMVVGGVPAQLTASAVRPDAPGARVDLSADGDAWDHAAAIAGQIGTGDTGRCAELANSDAAAWRTTADTLEIWYATWIYGSRPTAGDIVSAFGRGWDMAELREVTDRPDAAQLDWAADTRHGLVTGTACP